MPSLLQVLRARASSQRGFTLIELLVVILIIGILAAMAIPTFLAQRSKAQDASAKTDARNMLTQVEACFTTELTYANCDTSPELNPAGQITGLTWGTTAGTVEVVASPAASTTFYRIVGHSKSGNNFTINKASGVVSRMCNAAAKGACPVNGSW